MTPLNGEKTHPLSQHAIGKLRELALGPMPSLRLNPGVINRFMCEDLAELFQGPSPFPSHKGRNTQFIRITLAGLARLREIDAV